MQKKSFIILITTCVLLFIILIVVTIMTSYKTPKVISYSPADKSQNNSIYQVIQLTFDKPLSSSDLNSLSLETTPKIEGSTTFSQDERTIYLTPNTPLALGQQYTATFTLSNNQTTWSFNTVAVGNVSPEDQAKAQTQADGNFTQQTQNLFSKYPWYNSLPLQTAIYFVYFDTSTGQFTATIYATQQKINTPEEIQTQKDEILSKLNALNINTTQYQINWIIK